MSDPTVTVTQTTVGITIPGNALGLPYSSFKVERTIHFTEPQTSEMAEAYEYDLAKELTAQVTELAKASIAQLGEAAPSLPAPPAPGYTQAAPVPQAAPVAPTQQAYADSPAGIGALVNGQAAAPAAGGVQLQSGPSMFGNETIIFPSEASIPSQLLEAQAVAELAALGVHPTQVKFFDNRSGLLQGRKAMALAVFKLSSKNAYTQGINDATNGGSRSLLTVRWDTREGKLVVAQTKEFKSLDFQDRQFLSQPAQASAF